MRAKSEEQRRGSANLSEIKPLRQILSRRLVARRVLVGHEEVAEINVKIRLVGADVGERLEINFRAGMLVQMRIRCHGEGETAARRTRGVKGKFRAVGELRRARKSRAKLVKVICISLQRADDQFDRHTGFELPHRRLVGASSGLRSVGHKTFHVLIHQHAQGDGVLFRSGENQIITLRGHGDVEIIRSLLGARCRVRPDLSSWHLCAETQAMRTTQRSARQ